ncbi:MULTISPECIES: GNAT family N-acetyltransferase [unclassified Caballeronia]|uniref:GNAT family N-acetyltransferase n=1 Tax=unclassified Caballeronia TaxID=2646786 RepID=UPI0020283781|nr:MULTISPECIES: GNAT family N-acetyltransferase [unclassified Caballeronia]MDR5775266.1 GNAT family N-acetyltransferase [Caballeronia sp. LZ002]MDR5800742.1 GNAT family N-acetyltransferase [Caballeronia sp. LZ001]MDR5850704.1 GNAT family N-acetyltransferase [Caballeronia sp. LZ003]
MVEFEFESQFPRVDIRPYQASDLDGVIDLFVRAVRESASEYYSPAQIDAWAQTDREEWHAARLSRPTWVAFTDDELAGFADVHENGLIDMMFVEPRHQRKGVATALLASIEEHAEKNGMRVLHTYASLGSQPFFEYCGFTMLLARAVEVRGQRFAQLVMEKVL